MGRKIVSGFSGKMGRVFIGGNEFCAEDWTIREVRDEEDTTSTCDAGYANQEYGVRQLEGTINYTWDVTNNPWISGVPDLSVGAKHAETKLYVHATSGEAGQDGPFFHFNLQVSGHENSVPVRGKVTGTVDFKSYGTYTLPVGNDTSGA